MVARGVLFALTADQEAGILQRSGNQQELVDFVANEIEVRWDKAWLAETDKTWDAMHQALADSNNDFEVRSPLHAVVLGGKPLHRESDYLVIYKDANQVRQTAIAIASVTDEDMRNRYFTIDQSKYDYDKDEEDCQATVGWFGGVREFYKRASDANRAVIFTVDQ